MTFFQKSEKELDLALHPNESFDLIKRRLELSFCGGAIFYYIDGYVSPELLTKMFEFALNAESVKDVTANMPYMEFESTTDISHTVTEILSGCTAFIIDGADSIYLLDIRKYPIRSITEPEKDKVLRGPHDGFTETLIANTVMIRRRIRDPSLNFRLFHIGSSTETDIALAFMKDKADAKLINILTNKLNNIKTDSITLGQQGLIELLVKKHRFNPFPKVRYTERPDAASAMIAEGSVIILCDNSPSAMIVPTSLLDFMQESDDYYFPVTIGGYLKLIRLITAFLTVFLTPIWYLLLKYPNVIPRELAFIGIQNEPKIPVIMQLLLAEAVVDGLKLASLNTPQSLSNSFSVVAGLILGDFAVEIGWFVPEVILYTAFTSLANYTQPSYELGYALKFMRIMILVLTAFLKLYGFIIGVIIMLLLIFTNSSISSDRGYLYPLIPFDGKKLVSLLLRRSAALKQDNSTTT